MATITESKVWQCSHCPLKTPNEENMQSHILRRECPNGSFSYREYKS